MNIRALFNKNKVTKNRSSMIIFWLIFTLLLLVPKPAYALGLDTIAGAFIWAIAALFAGIYYFFFLLAWIASGIMAVSLKIFVFEMGDFVNAIPSLRVVWTFFRDIANLGFIFILLYAAINTILDKPTQVGRTLAKLVIVAILINFSFFFVAFIADISNYLGFEIYNSINVTVTPSGGAADQVNVETEKLTTAILNVAEAVRVDTTNFANPEGNGGPVAFNNGNDSFVNEQISKLAKNLFSILLMIVLIFVFASASIMFIARFLMLVFAMVVSPIMLAMVILPSTENRFFEWAKNKVLAQAFWLPVFMLCMYLGLQVLTDPMFATGIEQATAGSGDGAGVIVIFAGHLIKYAMVMVVFLGSLIISKKMGAAGVDMATKFAGGQMLNGASWIGRNTGGRAASWYLRHNEDKLKMREGRSGVVGWIGNKQLESAKKIRDANYDFRNTSVGKLAGGKHGLALGDASKKTFISVKEEKERRIAAAAAVAGNMTDEEKKAHEKDLKAFKESESYKNFVRDQDAERKKVEDKYKKEIDEATAEEKTKLRGSEVDLQHLEARYKKASATDKPAIRDQIVAKKKEIEDSKETIAAIKRPIEDKRKEEVDSLREEQKKALDKHIADNAPKSAGQLRLDALQNSVSKRTSRQLVGGLLQRHPDIARWTKSFKAKNKEALGQISKLNEQIEEQIAKQRTATAEGRPDEAAALGGTIATLRNQVADINGLMARRERVIQGLGGWGNLTEDQIKHRNSMRRTIDNHDGLIKEVRRQARNAQQQLELMEVGSGEYAQQEQQIRKLVAQESQLISQREMYQAQIAQTIQEQRVKQREQGSWINQGQRRAAKGK